MELLEKKDYYKVATPLKSVTINNLFALSVIEQRVAGNIYVDNRLNPKTFYVVHPYGMTLLFGDSTNESFNSSFKDYALNKNHVRKHHEWMQAFPGQWNPILFNLFNGSLIQSSDNTTKKETEIIELNTRVNFKFNRERFLSSAKQTIPSDAKIVQTDRQLFGEMKGSVVPSNFWANEEGFLKKGVGFSLIYKNKLAATAFSSFVHDSKLELGIETAEEFRGHGFAENVCTSLINYCLTNNFEPVWACRLENIGSYKLAKKLGFEPAVEIPYYRLSK